MNAQGSPRVYRHGGAFFRSRSIRAQLVRILTLALLVVVVLVGILVGQQINSYNEVSNTTRIVTVTLSVQDVVHQLQRERGLTNGLLAGGNQYQAQLKTQRTQTDTALKSLNQTIADPVNANAGAPEVRTALGHLQTLASVRIGVDDRSAQPDPTFQFYTDAITALDSLQLGINQTQDDTVRHGLEALYSAGYAKEYMGQERGLLNGVFSSGHFTADEYKSLLQILAAKQAAVGVYALYASPSQMSALTTALHSSAAAQASADEAIAVNSFGGAIAGHVDATAWWNTTTTVVNDMRTVQLQIGADTTARAESLRADALTYLIGTLVIAAVAVGLLIVLLVMTLRSILGPLAALTREANDVASKRLPEAVAALQTATSEDDVPKAKPIAMPRRVPDEIDLVTGALDRLQDTAFALASEQALVRRNITAALSNLGRRNQNLLRRQLGLISQFERAELDPSGLANLFELDHLATRMRRNAESLLVLVGETSPRPWSKPLPVTDVIRAALSEVDDYRRVTMRRIDDAHISGSVVAEIAHMMAELIENALAFSSPDLEVEIYGRRTERGYLLVVVDHGVGMTPDELTTARARLRDEENFLVTPTRFLGHYVVGRLAAKLSVQVELYESPVTGITARLILPVGLLADPNSPGHSAEPKAEKSREKAREQVTDKATAKAVSKPEPSAAKPEPAATEPVPDMPAPREPVPDMPAPREPVPDTPSEKPAAAPVAETPGGEAHRPTNGFHTKQITWPGGILAEVDVDDESSPDGSDDDDRSIVGAHRMPEPERTRNGLVKRGKRATRPVVVHQTHHQPERETIAPDRSPAEISTMLAAFRAGHQRGASEPDAPQPPDTGQSPAEGSR